MNIFFNPVKAKEHPLTMMMIGIFYSSLSILLSAWIFPDHSSLVMVFLTLISCLYVVQGTIKLEEDKELPYKSETWILKQHSHVLIFLLFLFIGFVISFTFWTFVLPSEKVSVLFDLQSSVVDGIRAMTVTGDAVNLDTFFIILTNNLKVLTIALIFAFFYGAGAIFILVWNASVMGFVIGELAKNTFGIMALPIAFAKYFLHGIPEMLAYLTIALAGGIIYTAIWRGDFFQQGKAKKIILDTSILVLISIVMLIISALIEVYISPFI